MKFSHTFRIFPECIKFLGFYINEWRESILRQSNFESRATHAMSFVYGPPHSYMVPSHPTPVLYNPPTMGQPVIVQVSPTPTPQTIYFAPAAPVQAPAPQQIVYTPPPTSVVKAPEEKSLLSHIALALLLLILAITTMALAAYVV